MGTTNGKVPGRVKYTFAFGALGKDLIYGMMATFAMIYFTDVLKVSPGFVGIVFRHQITLILLNLNTFNGKLSINKANCNFAVLRIKAFVNDEQIPV